MEASRTTAPVPNTLAAISSASTQLKAFQDIPSQGKDINAQYGFELVADNVGDLDRWAPIFFNGMRELPMIKDLYTDQQNAGLQTTVTYDRKTAARFGITPQLADQSLYGAFGQAQVSTIYKSLNQYHVVMEAAPQYTQGPTGLNSLYIHPSDGGAVPLDALHQEAIRRHL